MKVIIPIVENEIKTDGMSYCRSLYEIERKTIIQHICESITKIRNADYIFILNKLNVEKYHLDSVIKLLIPSSKIVISQGMTKGSICSCLLAMDYLKLDEPLVITGGDQIATINLNDAVEYFQKNDYDGGMITFPDIHPRWSYVRLNEQRLVVEAAEKHPISHTATTGFYYFKYTDDFIKSAFSMIKKNANVNGKYYVCPVYNEMILQQKLIGIYPIDKEQYFNFSHFKGIELYEEYCRRYKDESEKVR